MTAAGGVREEAPMEEGEEEEATVRSVPAVELEGEEADREGAHSGVKRMGYQSSSLVA